MAAPGGGGSVPIRARVREMFDRAMKPAHRLDPDPGNAVPFAIRHQLALYRAVFYVYLACVLAVLITIPRTWLWTRGSSSTPGQFSLGALTPGLLLVALVVAHHWSVCGSDPGYIPNDLAVRIGEEHRQHHDDDDDHNVSALEEEDEAEQGTLVAKASSTRGGDVAGSEKNSFGTMDDDEDDDNHHEHAVNVDDGGEESDDLEEQQHIRMLHRKKHSSSGGGGMSSSTTTLRSAHSNERLGSVVLTSSSSANGPSPSASPRSLGGGALTSSSGAQWGDLDDESLRLLSHRRPTRSTILDNSALEEEEEASADDSDDSDDDAHARAAHDTSSTSLPIRAKYCHASKAVVATFDHHCQVLNTTIGERNRARFWLLLFWSTLALVWAVALAHSGFRSVGSNPSLSWLDVNAAVLAGVLLVWANLLFVGLLFLFHTFLMLANVTSREFMRSDKLAYLQRTKDFDLPFSMGMRANIVFYFTSDSAVLSLVNRLLGKRTEWKPHLWPKPNVAQIRLAGQSEDVWANPWQNKYWSCC